MTINNVCYWKRLWRWISSQSLSKQELSTVINKNVIEGLQLGICIYKPLKQEVFAQLQAKYPDQSKLLNVVQTLQTYIDVDCFQVWDILENYLCDISYGTPASALKNFAFVDTRPSFLLPNTWNFYFSERLFLLKILHYIYQFKSDENHKYNEQFLKIINDIQIKKLKDSLIQQFEKLLNASVPSRRIQIDIGNDNIRQEWAESNLREQLAILQILVLIANEEGFDDIEFIQLFKLFRKHGFGISQSYDEILEDRHKDACSKIMYMELGFLMVVLDKNKIKNLSGWINKTKESVELELTKLAPIPEHGIMLITWMLLTLQSEEHARLFQSQYQHYGATALRMKVFEMMHKMINSCVYTDNSKCAHVVRYRVFQILNDLCDKFDGDGTLSNQPGIIQLSADLLQSESLAKQFWSLHQRTENYGVVSLWNTALEYFPYNFNALSILAAGLAEAGKDSVRHLIAELKNLPVYTEIYNPNVVPLMSLQGDDAAIGREYYPLGNQSYKIEVGSKATVMERKEGTMIHYRTPCSYWTVFNHEIEKALDRRQEYQNIHCILERVLHGTKVLKAILKCLVVDKEIPKVLVAPSEGVFDVLVRFMRAESPPLPLLVECLNVCTALIPIFAKEIHLRLSNTGLLPRLGAGGVAGGLQAGATGGYLALEGGAGRGGYLAALLDLLAAFRQASDDERIITEIVLPGLVLLLQEVFPNIREWRYNNNVERKTLVQSCTKFLVHILEQPNRESTIILKKTCIYSFLHTENALELLKIISVGNERIEKLIQDETNWVSGNAFQHTMTIQHCIAIVMSVLRQKSLVDADEVTPLEHLIFAQNKQKDTLKVVPKVTSYIKNAFSKSLSVLSCRLLKKFADGFQMSLFSSLDMTAYQVRVIFLDRLRDDYETIELKIAILEFVTSCIGKQPGLTEAFFMMNHEKAKADEKIKQEKVKSESADTFEGILGYMADYLGFVRSDAKLLHSSVLACIMGLFHALWKNNMQILVKKLREQPKFWEYITSPLFSEIQPGLHTYGQIFNVLGIEMFVSRGKLDPDLEKILNQFFDVSKTHLDTWIDFVFSFEGRTDEEVIDKTPIWLGLLTSWKDFITISCKCLPISLNIAHKSKIVAPCMSALLNELDDLKDGRLVTILAELYVIMLANWKDDCFDNRQTSSKQIDNLLTNTAVVYEDLHPRAVRAILSIGTVAISSLDYEIKANSVTAQSIIRSVTNINSLELQKLLDVINDDKKSEDKIGDNKDIPTINLSLAMLEQCLELYDDMFSGLSQWFQSTKFINKLLCCLQYILQNRRYYNTSLAALRCLTAYARGPFSKELLMSDVDQFLWLQLLPPKFENNGNGNNNGHKFWKPQEWWRVYAYSLDFITIMLMRHGQFFTKDAITFVGVHLEHLVEAVLLPRQVYNMDSLNLCASVLNLVVQLVKFEQRWRMENINSLIGIMRAASACVQQCVWQLLASRRAADPAAATLDRLLEVLYMATLSLLAFSPDLLSLLAQPDVDLERWQPLVEFHFGAPKITYEPFPQLTFGTLLSAVCLLTRSLNHAHHLEESGGGRSPRGRRRACSCSSPSPAAASPAAASSPAPAPAPPAPAPRLLAAAAHAQATLLAQQALLALRDPNVPARHKQLVRRELASELTVYHEFVRKRIVCAAHARPYLARNKLGAWPLAADEHEAALLQAAASERGPARPHAGALPPPPPPKRASHDSMREYILRKHYLDKCAQTPIKDPPSPVSHSTPTSDKKKENARGSKRVSWAETTRDSEEHDAVIQDIEPAYSNLTDVQINNDDDYFHFMSIVFLYICQTEL